MKPPERYTPATVRLIAPAVYRPGIGSTAQTKGAQPTLPPAPIRSAPPVYRPAGTAVLMLKPGVVQRTVASAASALFATGVKEVKRSMLNGRFCKDHEVETTDLAAIQTALDALREAAPAKKAVAIADVTIPANRPTTGGMVEEDATKLAASLGWTQVTGAFTCTDPSHSPKGKIYTNGESFYGADNTGHVGWGFKVWTKKNKTTLNYSGNITWDGTEWKHHARGTSKPKR